MKKTVYFKSMVFPLVALFLLQPIACFKRAIVVPPDVQTTPREAIPVDPPPPSTVFKKKTPPMVLNPETPWVQNTQSLGLVFNPHPPEGRLGDFNRYLYSNASVKTKKLTGFDHFLNSLWQLSGYVLAGAAALGVIGATQHK